MTPGVNKPFSLSANWMPPALSRNMSHMPSMWPGGRSRRKSYATITAQMLNPFRSSYEETAMATATSRVTVNGRHDASGVERHDRATGEQRQGEDLLTQWLQGLFLDSMNAKNKAL